VLPESAVGKACSYTLALWKKLTRFLEYPQLEFSNNLAENSMRYLHPLQVSRHELDLRREPVRWEGAF
jgi:hypothetical protein